MKSRSVLKRQRQNGVRRMRNHETKSAARTAIKKFEAAVAAGDKDLAAEKMALSFKLLDKAVSKGALHKNTASRKKSRIHVRYNHFVAGPGEEGKKAASAAVEAN